MNVTHIERRGADVFARHACGNTFLVGRIVRDYPGEWSIELRPTVEPFGMPVCQVLCRSDLYRLAEMLDEYEEEVGA